MVLIQADSGLDNGNLYTKVSKESFIYPPTEYTVVTKQSPEETCHEALERAISSPVVDQYAVIDDTWIYQYKENEAEEKY